MQNRMMLSVGVGVGLVFLVSGLAHTGVPWVATVQVEAGMSADAYKQRAVVLMEQADQKYSPDFFGQSLGQEALAYANAAPQLEPSNPTYIGNMAPGYTKTQFWIQGYQLWKELERIQPLSTQDLEWATLSAAKVEYIRMTNGFPPEAEPYFSDPLNRPENAEDQALLKRIRVEVSGLQ